MHRLQFCPTIEVAQLYITRRIPKFLKVKSEENKWYENKSQIDIKSVSTTTGKLKLITKSKSHKIRNNPLNNNSHIDRFQNKKAHLHGDNHSRKRNESDEQNRNRNPHRKTSRKKTLTWVSGYAPSQTLQLSSWLVQPPLFFLPSAVTTMGRVGEFG